MDDIIIVGAGPIGLYGATLAALHLLKGRVIEGSTNVGGQLSSLYPEKAIVDLPGFASISAQGFIDKLMKQYEDNVNKLPLHLNETVLSFEKKDSYYLVTTSKGTYETKCILLTTGMGSFSPRKTGLANEDNKNNIIYSISSSSLYKGKDIVILGGGDSAVDWAIALKEVAASVTIVHRREEFRAQSSSVEKMERLGVNVLKNQAVISLNGEEDKLESITIKSNVDGKEQTIPLDFLFVNYGQVTTKDSFEVEKLNNLIVTKDNYQTSLENVFACGNIIAYPGKVKNITCGLGEVVVAITKIDQIINPNKNIPIHF
ncbi:MAG: NAD(P)/FAD-dependent oxidoreductase [Erysipelotrichaceae bacterium]|nr:NAD(P)/FAD-dependent oxidoreductase [Erysipelotrichaceae bacterium]